MAQLITLAAAEEISAGGDRHEPEFYSQIGSISVLMTRCRRQDDAFG